VPRLRMSGETPSLPLYAFMACGEKGLLFTILILPPPCQYQYPKLYTPAVSLSTLWNLSFTAQIFSLLTICPPLDQGAKTLLSPASLLHNPSWCTLAPLVHMATIPLAQHWHSCHPHQCLCLYNTPRSSCGHFFLDYWPWRWSTMIF
jgi:hypothetical protein